MRTRAYGEDYQPTPVDRFGVWLSARTIGRFVRSFAGKRMGDFGCGYDARFARSILDRVERATLVDVRLADDLKTNAKVTAIEGTLPDVLHGLESASLDIVLCVSVLEHLWEPLEALREFRRLVAPGGLCLFNVPSWRGKAFLEFSAFRLGLSPRDEMNDHKMYYDVRDFWPILVRSGFRPEDIRCFSHKFGFNTFAVCRAESR